MVELVGGLGVAGGAMAVVATEGIQASGGVGECGCETVSDGSPLDGFFSS